MPGRRNGRSGVADVGIFAFLVLTCAAVALSACGDSQPTAQVNAESAADQELASRIQQELSQYEGGFDIDALPPGQQAELGGIVDNLPQAAGGVQTLTVSGGVVEALTDFPADANGADTGRLICGAIYRSVGPNDPGGHRVLGADGAVLADCEPDDANFP